MKKLLFSAVSVLAVGAALAADSTQFGVLTVPSSATNTIVSVPWIESATGDKAVSVSNLVLTSGLNVGDELRWYDSSKGSYQCWQLALDQSSRKYWQAASGGQDAGKQGISCGEAIILFRDPKNGTVASQFYIMGKPASSVADLNLASGTATTPVWSLVAPPAVTNVNPNAYAWTNLKAGLDVLHVPNGTSGAVSTYTWSGQKFWDSKRREPTITAGMGAWFVSRDTTAGKKVSWSAK